MNTGKITISRIQSSNSSWIEISTDDEKSGLHIMTAKMSLEDFAKAVTGFGRQDIKYDILSSEYMANLGKKKETKTIAIPLPEGGRNKDDIAEIIPNYIPEGWLLWSDGLSTQQHVRGVHNIIICRYI